MDKLIICYWLSFFLIKINIECLELVNYMICKFVIGEEYFFMNCEGEVVILSKSKLLILFLCKNECL